MIDKIKIKQHDIEEILDTLSPSWRSEQLYSWQWGAQERSELDPHKVLDLKNFETRDLGRLISYQSGRNFVLMTHVDPSQDYQKVLTNIEPKSKDTFFVYDPKGETREVTIDQLI